jgi:hypothetical protein
LGDVASMVKGWSKHGRRCICTLLALVFCSVGAAEEGGSAPRAVTTLAGATAGADLLCFPSDVSLLRRWVARHIAVADTYNNKVRIVVVATGAE